MKTNQQMEVKINKDLTIRVGHKTRLGKANEVFKHGNWLREQKGLRPYDDITQILNKRSFWEDVIAINTLKVNLENPSLENEPYSSDFSELDNYLDSKGRAKVKELIKQFPNLIKSQRGGKVENRGYWMDLQVLLVVATMLDPDLKAQIYHIFIEGKILELRDEGGNNFKLLNKAIDTLPDRSPELKQKGNKGCYIQVAKLLREKLEIDGRGYNGEDYDRFIQEKRIKYEEQLVSFIDMGFVKSFEELKLAINKI